MGYPRRLGPKLHLWLVSFLLLLGGATAAVVVFGFERGQDNATDRSRQGLEEQGREQLEFYASAQAQLAYLQFASITSASQQAADVMFSVRESGPPESWWNGSDLIRGSGGQLYDADPARVTDVFVPNTVQLTPEVLDELKESAVLDGIFPSLLEKFPGKARTDNFDAIAVYYTSASGTVRYYPPDGFPERIDPATPVQANLQAMGPAENPERKTLWTAPYTDIAGRGLVMTARTPVYEGDQFKGIIGVDLSMARLIAQLDAVHPTPAGFAFFIDSTGELVDSAAAPRVGQEIAAHNTELERILYTMTWTPRGTERATIGGEEVFISYDTMQDVGGRLAVVAPISELTTEAAAVKSSIDREGNRTVAATLAVMGLFFILALGMVAYLSRRVLVDPIGAILAGTKEVGAGNLGARIHVHSDDELGELARSFNTMTEQLAQAQHTLEARVDERTRELRALLDVSNTMSSTLEIERLFGVILEQLKVGVDYTGGSILLVEGDYLVTREARIPRGPVPPEALDGQRFSLSTIAPIWHEMVAGNALLIDDVRDDSQSARDFRVATGDNFDTSFAQVRSFLGAPLVVKDRTIGMIALSHPSPGVFTEHHAAVVSAIATQAGIAVENAYLLAQTQRSAALEERQRLARELHDSVSQALYGIALGARTARKRLDSDPQNLHEPLDYVLSLAEAGLTEMRALIFELRPDSIETEGLVAALGRQVAATQARYGVTVKAELSDEPDIPVAAKEALYRIAQEAMHNTVKHARASHIDLSLSRHNGHLHLRIKDDGMGFDPGGEFPGHLGLRSMRERMLAIGGTFEISSSPGDGTCINVTAPTGVAAVSAK